MMEVRPGRNTPLVTFVIALLLIVALLCIIVLSFPVPGRATAAPAQPSPRDLVRRSMEDGPLVAYEGTQVVVYWFAGGSTACLTRVVHGRPNLTRIEYLPSAGQSYRVVVSDGRFTWRYEPSLRVVFRSPCPSESDKGDVGRPGKSGPARDEDFDLLERNYRFALLGMDYVAGRQTYVVGILPKREGNPAKKIWVDAQYPLILRSEDYNSDGALYVLSYFLRIKLLKSIPDEVFQFRIPRGVKVIPQPGEEGVLPVEKLRELVSFDISPPGEVPPGYVLKGGRLTDLDSEIKGVHLLYTDGLNTISFFERPVPPNTGMGAGTGAGMGMGKDAGPGGTGKVRVIPGEARVLKINGAPARLSNRNDAKVLHWEVPGYSFALIGDVSDETLMKIAESVSIPSPAKEGNGANGGEQGLFERPIWKFLIGIFIFRD